MAEGHQLCTQQQDHEGLAICGFNSADGAIWSDGDGGKPWETRLSFYQSQKPFPKITIFIQGGGMNHSQLPRISEKVYGKVLLL